MMTEKTQDYNLLDIMLRPSSISLFTGIASGTVDAILLDVPSPEHGKLCAMANIGYGIGRKIPSKDEKVDLGQVAKKGAEVYVNTALLLPFAYLSSYFIMKGIMNNIRGC